MLKRILSNTTYFWIILIVVFVLSRLATWFFPYDSDHWLFYYVGKIWAQGGTLYVSAFDHKPPIIFVINALMSLCFDDNLIVHRIFFTFISISSAYVFYLVSGQIFKNISAKNTAYLTRLALIVFVFWTNLSQFTNSGNNTENFGILFLLLMTWLYLKFHISKKTWLLFVSGIFFAILFWLKPNMILLSLPIWIDLVFFDKSGANSLYASLANKIKLILIFLLPWVVLTIYWYLYFHNNGSYDDFILASFTFSAKYAASAWEGHVSAQNIFIFILASFLIPYILFIAIYFKNTIKLWRTDTNHRFLALWIISALIYIAIMGSFYTYYYLIVLPILILGMIASIEYIRSIAYLKILSVVFILSMCTNYTISSKQLYNSFQGEVKTTQSNDQEIAKYIQNHTNNDDTILAYVYGATFYELTHRDSGTRYITASHLLLDERENFGFGLTDKYINDAQISKPVYLIFPNPNNNQYDLYSQNKKAVDYLLSHYELEKEFAEYSVYRKK